MMLRPFIEILSEIPDFRKAKGKRHSLSAILSLACVAIMCGCHGYRAIAEADYIDWPGLKQVFMLERKTTFKNGKHKPRRETVYDITSLSAEQADASQLQHLVRSHWIRDVTFGEDHSHVRYGNIPQVMAALRNTAIGLMRWLGYENIAAACSYFAAQPWDALEAIGISR